jgi:hypothetical protein
MGCESHADGAGLAELEALPAPTADVAGKDYVTSQQQVVKNQKLNDVSICINSFPRGLARPFASLSSEPDLHPEDLGST